MVKWKMGVISLRWHGYPKRSDTSVRLNNINTARVSRHPRKSLSSYSNEVAAFQSDF